MSSSLNRRRFLTLAAASAGASLAGCSWREQVAESVASSTTTTPATLTSSSDPTSGSPPLLVVVNLGGGNDALNTVVPTVGGYYDLRPNVRIEDTDLLALDDIHGLHPSLAPLLPQWEAGHLAVVQGIGLEGQTRSHFAATDAIFAGHAPASQTGWIGRWLDQHPNATTDPLLTIALGGGRGAVVGETAQATVITKPEQFLMQTAPGMSAEALTEVLIATASSGTASESNAMSMIRAGIPNAVHAVKVLDSVEVDPNTDAFGADSAQLLLAVAAQIVEVNLSTEVLFVDLGGFDTHGSQLATHADLLSDFAIGVAALLERTAGLDRDVLVVTTSEFGRRGEDNGSGTDHGLAGSSLLIGASVDGQIVGELAVDRLMNGDLPIEIDTRSLYANALSHLGADPDNILGGTFDRYSLT